MPQVSSAVPIPPDPDILFQTTAPPPVLTMAHIGRISLKVTWPHVYGTSEFIDKYRVTLNPGGVTADVVAPNEGDLKEYTFTGLAMNYPYVIEVRAVNLASPPYPEAVGPPGVMYVSTLPEWSEPPGRGIDGWTGSQYVGVAEGARTQFAYLRSGWIEDVNNWAADAIKNQKALVYPGGATADNQIPLSWVEFTAEATPDLLIMAVLIKAGHRWPQ